MTHSPLFNLQQGQSFQTSAVLFLQRTRLVNYTLAAVVGLSLGLLCLLSPWLALVAVLVVAAGIVALLKPIFLCYIMVPAITLTSGMERGRLIPFFKPNEAVLALSVAVVLLIVLANKQRRMADLSYVVTVFIVLTPGVVLVPLVYYYLRGIQLTTGDIFWLIAPLQYFLLFWLFAVAPQNEAERRRLVLLMLLSTAIVALVGLAQAAHIGIVTRLLNSWYPSEHLKAVMGGVGRITSLVGAWNTLGILLATTIIIGWAILPVITGTFNRIITLTTMSISGICLLASGSFAGVGGAVMGILMVEFLAQRGMRVLPVLLWGAIGLTLIFLLLQPVLRPLIESRLNYQFGGGGSTPQTLGFRFRVWREVFLPPIRENFPWPVLPYVPLTYAWTTEESQYIMLLFRIGFLGLLSHLTWVTITLLWLYRRLRNSDGLSKAIIMSAITLLIVLSIQGLTNSVFTWLGTIDYLWILLGLIAANSLDKEAINYETRWDSRSSLGALRRTNRKLCPASKRIAL